VGIIDNKKAFKDVSEKTVKEYWIWNKKKRGFIIISAFFIFGYNKMLSLFRQFERIKYNKKKTKKYPESVKIKIDLIGSKNTCLFFPLLN